MSSGIKNILTLLSLSTLSSITYAEESKKEDSKLNTIIVTATQTESLLKERSESVGVINQDEINEINPTHASDLFNRIPGVNIVQLGSGGQGVAASIRQPISYGPVYLYLENGVPVRSPAFFNHNALYEMNLTEAQGAEIIKGPGSALYGSDAIGGVINLISNREISGDEGQFNLEFGSDEWKRIGLKHNSKFDNHAFSIKLNVIDSEGWREQTNFDRQNLSVNWQTSNSVFNKINTLLTYTAIDMQTGGSGLRIEDFETDPEQPGNLIGYRNMEALRLSSAMESDFLKGTLKWTPYLRSNDLEYIATWTLNTGREVFVPWLGRTVLDSQDAHINASGHDSLGFILNYHQPYTTDSGLEGFYIVGLDVDRSQGDTQQTYIERSDQDPGNYWLSYRESGLLYDFDVDFSSVSPYLHLEQELTSALRLNAGMRYDSVKYDYQNNLSTVTENSIHLRPADTVVKLEHFSPKLGLTYAWNDNFHSYMSYRNAFRIPSASQLFRSGRTESSTELKPVIADSFEIGFRGDINNAIDFELAFYYMEKKDDIVSLRNVDGSRTNANVGKTKHKGLELGVDIDIAENWVLGYSYTTSTHKFDEWQVSSSADYSENKLPLAPSHYTNLRLQYLPSWLNDGRIELELLDQGGYFIDEQNENRYEGYNLVNFRANYNLSGSHEIYLNIFNLTDKLFAETASKWGPTYTPGRPRSFYLGYRYRF